MNIITTLFYVFLAIAGLTLNLIGALGSWYIGAAVISKFLFS